MKLEQALEVMDDLLGEGPYFPPEMRRKAVKLGIEAMKRVLDVRRFPEAANWKPLPGETPEA